MHVLTFVLARPRAFAPRVIEFGVPFTSTVPEPSAATPAATGFAGLISAAFGTSGIKCAGNRSHGRFCRHVNNDVGTPPK